MKTKLSQLFITLTCVTIFSFSCKKDDPKPIDKEPPVAGEFGSMDVSFEHVVDSAPLVFNKEFLNASGDTFTVTRFLYYISNVILIKNDGSKFVEPNSYHLINHANLSSLSFAINNIPVGTYESINFLIGIDSTRNVSGIQSGDLDPAKGMFWTWNSGYIFFKMEGKAPKSPGNKSFTYHIGGFEGEYKTQRKIVLKLKTDHHVISKSQSATLKLNVDVNEIFKNPNLIDISKTFYQMSPGPQAKVFADNYASMITVK